ncbi:hypothetical protein Landi51_09780 [Colletotrichum acutatum]
MSAKDQEAWAELRWECRQAAGQQITKQQLAVFGASLRDPWDRPFAPSVSSEYDGYGYQESKKAKTKIPPILPYLKVLYWHAAPCKVPYLTSPWRETRQDQLPAPQSNTAGHMPCPALAADLDWTWTGTGRSATANTSPDRITNVCLLYLTLPHAVAAAAAAAAAAALSYYPGVSPVYHSTYLTRLPGSALFHTVPQCEATSASLADESHRLILGGSCFPTFSTDSASVIVHPFLHLFRELSPRGTTAEINIHRVFLLVPPLSCTIPGLAPACATQRRILRRPANSINPRAELAANPGGSHFADRIP